MLKFEIEKKPFYIANISGGKDSMYMLDMILKNPEVFPLNAVMHLELEIDYPFIKPIIERMKESEKKYNCCVIDGHGKYNAEYLDNIIKTKWINILNERLCYNGQK